jgi:hypothetical protein
MDIAERFRAAAEMQEVYADFRDFADDGMHFLGFPLTDMQRDIALYMEEGPSRRMVMAQRGEAKSTLAALYAVWRLIMQNSARILVVSGGETQASEVAILIIRVINGWDILEYMRPDKSAGDRSSMGGFDLHWSLKGVEKSPSVTCAGVTAQLQGKRADLLLADDVETIKNGLTATQRGHLLQLTKEFSSIVTHGDILYLGTPQTRDSIYNGLPGRGFDVRIWPGRFPTPEEQQRYGERLAPFLAERIALDPTLTRGGGLDGTKGKPSDTGRYTEDALLEKELDQGPEGFQLQYMLDTSLSDAARQQLKLSDLIVANYGYEMLPEVQMWQSASKYEVPLGIEFPIKLQKMYYPVPMDCRFVKPEFPPMMYVDPAGGGADELGYAISASVGPYIHLLDVKGLKGGFTDGNIEQLIKDVKKYGIKYILCESNMGHGLFEINLRAALAEHEELSDVGVEGEYSTGQKERRIIDSFVTASQRHKIVVHQQVLDSDIECGKQHSLDKRATYSFFYQYNNITTDRKSLVHDDRLEAAAGAVRHWKNVLGIDEDQAADERAKAVAAAYVRNPMGYDETPGRVNYAVGGARALAYQRRNY